jgi:hypothetical protein
MITGIVASRAAAGPVATSYTNPLGSGDRRALITMSKSSFTHNGVLNTLINGSLSSTSFWFNPSAAVAGHWIKFDFGSAKVIQGIHINQQNTVGSGTWRLEGSNNDSTWTTVSPNFTWPMSNSAFDFTNPNGAYRYYRIFGVSGNSNAVPYQHEIRFKISV